jgi:hypothetical protein
MASISGSVMVSFSRFGGCYFRGGWLLSKDNFAVSILIPTFIPTFGTHAANVGGSFLHLRVDQQNPHLALHGAALAPVLMRLHWLAVAAIKPTASGT